MASKSSSPIKVLFILGWGRSGSTLLDMALGGVDGFTSSGELSAVWEAAFLRRSPCGCGRPLLECSVWRGVLEDATRGEGTDLLRMADLRIQLSRERHTFKLLREAPHRRKLDGELGEYVRTMNSVYRLLSVRTEADVIVDSSKVTSDAAMLLLMDDIDPYFVHLIRDPRATAFSWTRHTLQPEGSGSVSMPRYGVAYSTGRWLARNLSIEYFLRHSMRPAVRLRYEDLTRDPAGSLHGILSMVGLGDRALPLSGNMLQVSVGHTVSGNPIRTTHGEIRVDLDDRWRTSLSRRHQWLASTLAWPLMKHYGYLAGLGRG